MAQQGNIAQFNAGDNIGLKPSDEGAHALSEAAYREGQFYRQAGADITQAGDRIGEQAGQAEYADEISKGSATWSTLFANKTAQWNQAVAQPGAAQDKTLGQSFMQNSLEPDLQDFQNAFSTTKGQDWALSRANDLRQHFGEKVSADSMTLAGEGRLQDFTTNLNQLASTAYRDPTTADVAFGHIDETYKAMMDSGTFTPEQQSKAMALVTDMKKEVALNQVKGMADNVNDPQGPAKARALLDTGVHSNYIPAEQQQTLHRYIDNQEASRIVEKTQKDTAVQVQKTDANSQEVNSVFSQLASGQGYLATTAFSNQKLTTQQRNDLVAKNDGILTLPHSFLTSPTYGDGFNQAAKAVYGGQPITAAALTAGVRRQEITPAGAVQLQQLSDKMKTPQGVAEMNAQNSVLAQMRTQIVKGGPNTSDPVGEKNYNSMLNTFYPAWNAAISSGKTPAQLADPASKDYIGNIANTFQRSPAQALADVTKVSVPSPAVRIPTQANIDMLKKDPTLAPMFDKNFGKGSADKVLTPGWKGAIGG